MDSGLLVDGVAAPLRNGRSLVVAASEMVGLEEEILPALAHDEEHGPCE